MKLSQNFSMDEFIASDRATKDAIDNEMAPELISNAIWLCTVLLEPARTRFGPLRVTSGYRCAQLNEAVHGKPDSAHLYGCAADIEPAAGWSDLITREVVIAWYASSGLPYDQIIDEGFVDARGVEHRWCHIGSTRPGHDGPRKEALLFRNGDYVPFSTSLV